MSKEWVPEARLKIEAVTIQNFRAFPPEGQEVDDLTDCNVIYGPNNSGKSTFLEALSTLVYAFQGGEAFPYSEHVYRGRDQDRLPEIRFRLSGLEYWIPLFLWASGRDGPRDLVYEHKELLRFDIPIALTVTPKEEKSGLPGTRWGFSITTDSQAWDRYLNGVAQASNGTPPVDVNIDHKQISLAIRQALEAILHNSVFLFFPGDRRIRDYQEATSPKDLPNYWTGLFAHQTTIDALCSGEKFNQLFDQATSSAEPLRNVIYGSLPRALEEVFGESAQDFYVQMKRRTARSTPDRPQYREIHLTHDEDSELVPLSLMGGGYRNAFHILASILITDRMMERIPKEEDRLVGRQLFIAIEEPENDLHPSLHGRFVDVLRNLRPHHSKQLFLTSQSISLASGGLPVRSYRALPGRDAEVVPVEADPLQEVIEDLGFEAAKLFSAERILFVEGPTEQHLIRRIIELLDGDLTKLLVWSLNGSDSKIYADDLTKLEQLSEYRAAVGLLLDSERSEPEDEIEPWRLGLVQAFKENLGDALLLEEVRAVENLIRPEVISRVYGIELTEEHWGPYTKDLSAAVFEATGERPIPKKGKPRTMRRLAAGIHSEEDLRHAEPLIAMVRRLLSN